MEGYAHPASSDRDGVPSPTACAGAVGMRPDDAAPGVAWLSSRPEYWPPPGRDGPRDLPPWGAADVVRGVACLLFGVGAGGAGWLARLERSVWFAGLRPRAEDLAPGDAPRGGWAEPAGIAGDGGRVAAGAGTFFASAPLPRAWYAAVAVPRGAGPVERSAALGLVGALRGRRDPLGRRLAVVVTADAPSSLDGAFVRDLLDRGAFVVRAGLDAAGDHLHHFPLRAPMCPRGGRLVCVDFADWLHTWRPGRVADLHVIPSRGPLRGPALSPSWDERPSRFSVPEGERSSAGGKSAEGRSMGRRALREQCPRRPSRGGIAARSFDDAVQALHRVPVPADGARALNLVSHLDRDALDRGAPGDWLRGMECLAGHCHDLFLEPDGDMVFTDADRLDGRTGSADLLIVRGGDR